MESYEAKLIESAQKSLYQNYRQPPMVLVRGRGCEVWDASGKRYLDLCAGIAVSTLGHAHPRLVQAISEQAGRLIHTSNYFYNEPNLRLAEKLCALTRMARAFFCNSGTEAIEAMLKMARRHFYARGEKDRYRIIAFDNSFHGRTLGALAMTGQPKYRDGFGPLVGVTHVPYGDLGAVKNAMGADVAGIIVEPVQGEGGVLPAPEGFLRGLRTIADEHGAVLLADEVQTGVGRTGKFLAFEHDGIEPDAVALAKALGGGVPIGAMLCKSLLADALPAGSHGSTFGGNPLASAAGLAVIETLESEGLIESVPAKAEHLKKALVRLSERHSKRASGSRGRGLLQALVMREGLDLRELLNTLREAGLLLTQAGAQGLRFSPPLIVTTDQLDEGVEIVDRVLEKLK
jgi:acetylornithine/N-succinyldiaminopimelate aminotransferase